MHRTVQMITKKLATFYSSWGMAVRKDSSSCSNGQNHYRSPTFVPFGRLYMITC